MIYLKWTSAALIVTILFSVLISSMVGGVIASSLPRSSGTSRGTIAVPLSWCALSGSPASTVSSTRPSTVPGFSAILGPPPGPPSAPRTSTDLVLKDRHFRVDFSIDFLDQAAVLFTTASPVRAVRNSDNNEMVIPKIDDFHPSISRAGGTVAANFPLNPAAMSEFNRVINLCRAHWNIAHPGSQTGLTAVNIGHFVNGVNGVTVSPILGFGGCFVRDTMDRCSDGRSMVVDNEFTFNGVPRDPEDIVLGASLGYALGAFVQHIQPRPFPTGCIIGLIFFWPGAVFNSDCQARVTRGVEPNDLLQIQNFASLLSNNRFGVATNDHLNLGQSLAIFFNAHGIPSFPDPPPRILAGPTLLSTEITEIDESKKTPVYLDLSAEQVAMNTNNNTISFKQELAGLIPKYQNNSFNAQYITFIDTDSNETTGAQQKLLSEQTKIPNVKFNGAELVIKVVANGASTLTSSIWRYKDGNLVNLPRDAQVVHLERLFEFPIFSNATAALDYANKYPDDGHGVAVNDKVSVEINNNYTNINLNQPLRVQAMTATGSPSILVDKLDQTPSEHGMKFILEEPDANTAPVEFAITTKPPIK